MKEINLGPIANPDGSPSDLSLEMFGLTREQWEQRQAQTEDQIQEEEEEPPYEMARVISIPESQPNFYIYPGLEWIIKGMLKDFLQQNQDTPFTPESNDSWEWTVEEARKLFQKLS